MSLEGNHEIEPDLHGRMFQAFHTRFRFPADESESPTQLFYSFDLAGIWLQADALTTAQRIDICSMLLSLLGARTPMALVCCLGTPSALTQNSVGCSLALPSSPLALEPGPDCVQAHTGSCWAHMRTWAGPRSTPRTAPSSSGCDTVCFL